MLAISQVKAHMFICFSHTKGTLQERQVHGRRPGSAAAAAYCQAVPAGTSAPTCRLELFGADFSQRSKGCESRKVLQTLSKFANQVPGACQAAWACRNMSEILLDANWPRRCAMHVTAPSSTLDGTKLETKHAAHLCDDIFMRFDVF